MFVAPVMATAWGPVKAPLTTPWTNDVTVDQIPEYPRPQMVRSESSWQHMNGIWEIDYKVKDLSDPPFGQTLPDRILVPYPLESALSGIRKQAPNQSMFYRRKFDTILPNCSGRKVLHIEASDYNTTVWVNGQCLGSHVGGYDPFSFDITNQAQNSGNEVIVGVFDATETQRMDQSYGKQSSMSFSQPRGMNYAGSSGIWATVWAECVPQRYISDLYLQPDIDTSTLQVTVELSGGASAAPSASEPAADIVHVVMRDGTNKTVVEGTSAATNASVSLNLTVPDADLHLWSPADPYLYDLTVELVDPGTGSSPDTNPNPATGTARDTVGSYVGMRKVARGYAKLKQGGSAGGNGSGSGSKTFPMVLLNNKVLFHLGVLDQGWWPDGLYAAPTDAALRSDLERAKALGFNAVRKHMKVESRRWFRHCDTLGLLVWQDMPAPWSEPQPLWHAQIAAHWRAHRNSPALVQWELINEGWGPNDSEGTAAAVDVIRALERGARVVDDASGGRGWGCNYTIIPQRMKCPGQVCSEFWTGGCVHVSDVTDHHNYPEPQLPPAQPDGAGLEMPALLGEYGGFALEVEVQGHLWAPDSVCNAPPPAVSERDRLDAHRQGWALPSLYQRHVKQSQEQGVVTRTARVGAGGGGRLHLRTGAAGRDDPMSGLVLLNDTRFSETVEQFQSMIGSSAEEGGLFASGGLGSAIWTQITDIECEINGFLTYDRRVLKPDMERVASANRDLLQNITSLVVVE